MTKRMENLSLACVCGAKWEGGPFPTIVAEKFRAMFIEAHTGHTTPELRVDADLLFEEDE